LAACQAGFPSLRGAQATKQSSFSSGLLRCRSQ
jgi:hypothetical protein